MKRRVGIVVATREEQIPFFNVFGVPSCAHRDDAYDVSSWNKYKYDIYLIRSGYGEIAATAATQHIIDRFDVEIIINYGVVGALTDDLHIGDVGIVHKIVHYDFDLSATGNFPVGRYPNQNDLFLKPKEEAFSENVIKSYKKFICASADKFVEGGESKRQLQGDYGANICEMEAAGIVITCNKNKIPCSFIKAISDGVDEGSESFNDNVSRVSRICVEELAKILQI